MLAFEKKKPIFEWPHSSTGTNLLRTGAKEFQALSLSLAQNWLSVRTLPAMTTYEHSESESQPALNGILQIKILLDIKLFPILQIIAVTQIQRLRSVLPRSADFWRRFCFSRRASNLSHNLFPLIAVCRPSFKKVLFEFSLFNFFP